jgi:hypothetical protein
MLKEQMRKVKNYILTSMYIMILNNNVEYVILLNIKEAKLLVRCIGNMDNSGKEMPWKISNIDWFVTLNCQKLCDSMCIQINMSPHKLTSWN